MVRALMLGVAVIVTLYLLINFAYLHVLGLEGLRKSNAVGADLMRIVAGTSGAIVLSIIVCITALTHAQRHHLHRRALVLRARPRRQRLPPPRHLGGARRRPRPTA